MRNTAILRSIRLGKEIDNTTTRLLQDQSDATTTAIVGQRC